MKKWINPVNYYTGTVSVRAIMENLSNGFTRFPKRIADASKPIRRRKAPRR